MILPKRGFEEWKVVGSQPTYLLLFGILLMLFSGFCGLASLEYASAGTVGLATFIVAGVFLAAHAILDALWRILTVIYHEETLRSRPQNNVK